jgi:hypothetical protein
MQLAQPEVLLDHQAKAEVEHHRSQQVQEVDQKQLVTLAREEDQIREVEGAHLGDLAEPQIRAVVEVDRQTLGGEEEPPGNVGRVRLEALQLLLELRGRARSWTWAVRVSLQSGDLPRHRLEVNKARCASSLVGLLRHCLEAANSPAHCPKWLILGDPNARLRGQLAD